MLAFVENDGQSQSSFKILQDEKLKTSKITIIKLENLIFRKHNY